MYKKKYLKYKQKYLKEKNQVGGTDYLIVDQSIVTPPAINPTYPFGIIPIPSKKKFILLIDNLNRDNKKILKKVFDLSNVIFEGEHKKISIEPFTPKYDINEWINRFNGNNKSLGKGILVVTLENNTITENKFFKFGKKVINNLS